MNGPPRPIDPLHKPSASIASIPADAPIEDILAIIERDGGVVLKNLVSHKDLSTIDEELEPYTKYTKSTEKSALHIIPKETLAIPGLMGKSPAVAKICELPVLEKLQTSVLQENFSVIRKGFIERTLLIPC
ncbi:hypothetical protein B0T10DRAFT_563568 [Thelonectria olida]|uniref:Uncharacterized protein n=1 Tax=Thelonectria olida TaxID=1576542 RepID=A0A9P8W3M4_9HYPO|nr:hypothetical protein B0T10DRAFT_563568 [Thelonectria olida]